jgi:hypothetical protein
MKYVSSLVMMVLFLSVGLGSALGAADVSTDDQPNAVFTEMNHQFEKVVDGTLVTHDFAVKNTGKGILEISRVKTG